MKKILVLVFIMIMLLSTHSFKLAFGRDFSNDNAIYSFYILGKSCEIKNAKIITNGNSSIIKTKKKYANSVRKNVTNVMGESMSFEGDKIKLSLIKEQFEADYILDETIENEIIIFSGFSKKYEKDLKKIVVDGQNINFQVAYNNGIITIGTPIILGDY